MSAGLIIPTTTASIPNPNDQTETFCGFYLNPINSDQVAGTVVGKKPLWRNSMMVTQCSHRGMIELNPSQLISVSPIGTLIDIPLQLAIRVKCTIE